MTDKKGSDGDPRFHYEIWRGPRKEFGDERKAIRYVENHNAQCGYAELADDFKMAADVLIESYRGSGLGNWIAPIAHLVRQTMELRLKALLTAILEHDELIDPKPLTRHDLRKLWETARDWLIRKGYKIKEDARLKATESLIAALHAIDPSGDLFRFAISRQSAFAKLKSYDRVGIDLDILTLEFDAAVGLLSHWEAGLVRKIIAKEMKWDVDPFFDIEDFPRNDK